MVLRRVLCALRVVVVTAVCSLTARSTRQCEGYGDGDELGNVHQVSARVEERRGQSALPAPLARANFQTSFNLI